MGGSTFQFGVGIRVRAWRVCAPIHGVHSALRARASSSPRGAPALPKEGLVRAGLQAVFAGGCKDLVHRSASAKFPAVAHDMRPRSLTAFLLFGVVRCVTWLRQASDSRGQCLGPTASYACE